jgi:hypothetical protein
MPSSWLLNEAKPFLFSLIESSESAAKGQEYLYYLLHSYSLQSASSLLKNCSRLMMALVRQFLDPEDALVIVPGC